MNNEVNERLMASSIPVVRENDIVDCVRKRINKVNNMHHIIMERFFRICFCFKERG